MARRGCICARGQQHTLSFTDPNGSIAKPIDMGLSIPAAALLRTRAPTALDTSSKSTAALLVELDSLKFDCEPPLLNSGRSIRLRRNAYVLSRKVECKQEGMDSRLLCVMHLVLQRMDPANERLHLRLAVVPIILVDPRVLLRANVRKCSVRSKRLFEMFQRIEVGNAVWILVVPRTLGTY